MNRPLRALIALACGAALLSFAPFAVAQDHLGPAAGGMGEKWKEHQHERDEARARALHDILNIRADQEATFQAFIASMKSPDHGDHPGGPGGSRDELAHLTTPQRLDRIAAKMAEHQARFQQHADAVKRFYAALNPEQQRAFDALGAMHGMDGGGHMGPDPHEMGPHEMGPPGRGE